MARGTFARNVGLDVALHFHSAHDCEAVIVGALARVVRDHARVARAATGEEVLGAASLAVVVAGVPGRREKMGEEGCNEGSKSGC